MRNRNIFCVALTLACMCSFCGCSNDSQVQITETTAEITIQETEPTTVVTTEPTYPPADPDNPVDLYDFNSSDFDSKLESLIAYKFKYSKGYQYDVAKVTGVSVEEISPNAVDYGDGVRISHNQYILAKCQNPDCDIAGEHYCKVYMFYVKSTVFFKDSYGNSNYATYWLEEGYLQSCSGDVKSNVSDLIDSNHKKWTIKNK